MQPVVTTRSGNLRGAATEGGVSAFKGIPYAGAPTGANRFCPPQPVMSWTGVRDALEYGPTAPKAPYAAPFDQLIPEVDIPGEDFLNLNVWTPDPAGRLPVMVWLHGGAFANGSGSVPGYDGTRFARDGVVLVTVNYRLGADGFGRFDGTPANLGLLDQIAALHWVRDNIAAFGGDPDQVTLFGESAGAMSIGALLAVPNAAGLFHRAILQSGAAHHTLTPATAERIGHHLADLLDVPATRDDIAAVPVEQLVQAQQQLRAAISAEPDPESWGEAALNLMPFEPVIDGELLPAPPIDRITAGAGAAVDLLIGTNTDEFRLFLTPTGILDLLPEQAPRATAAGYGLDPDHALAVYRADRPDATPGELLAAIATDWFYRIPAVRLAEAHLQQRAGATYVYEFAWQPPTFNGRLGACHAGELPFVFDNLHDKGFTALLGTAPPQQLADTVHAAWVAFATTGDPGWTPYDTARRTTMRFDTVSATVTDPRPQERSLWDGHR
jgi:para-nitrobenzyl esterase